MEFVYTSCYCEENVYLLCKNLIELRVVAQACDIFVVFISNGNKQVPIWCQKNSSEGFCIWDYHVICIHKSFTENTEGNVWDLDTTLGLPTSFETYMAEAIRPDYVRNTAYQRFFRVIGAPAFFKYFASDRRHMKKPDGEWLAPPPEYNCIVAQDGSIHNLDAYITMDSSSSISKEQFATMTMEKLGCVLDEADFCRIFASGT